MYYIDLQHEGLHKFRRISGANKYVVEQKAQFQRLEWEQQYQRKRATDAARSGRAKSVFLKEQKKEEAAELTKDAEEKIGQLRSVLLQGLKDAKKFDWSALYKNDKFNEPTPTEPDGEPQFAWAKFKPRSTILSLIVPSIKRKYHAEAEAFFRAEYEAWRQASEKYAADCASRAKRRLAFDHAQAASNSKIDEFRQRYGNKENDAIAEYIDWVLGLSNYPDCFPKQWQMDLIAETGVMVIDYELPSVDALPKLKAVKYVQTRDSFDESFLRESELAQLYEDALYQACLRTLFEIFFTDDVDAIKSVTFNGWVNFTDKATGNPGRACIMSLQSSKETFRQINLTAVEPKACFRSLKGVGSAKLAGMSAVVPILRLNKNDERFIPAHDVIDSVGEATNIAAIPWEEFEFLVRDLFEKEFSQGGGEVKITRASRDHGVDAVAFDPDPIRGGKIVIQAKRYTNVVGVSAVRDLYGTLINEGANRGILVTTSQYGPDSYAFAKDKPITLLDGGNLLSLLERHGHRARIDLAEAKKLGSAREQL
jgi:restriction system protein